MVTIIVLFKIQHPLAQLTDSEMFEKLEIEGRIVGGGSVTTNLFPWQVSIEARNGTTGGAAICGGSLIDPNWVLTAAYCTRPYNTFSIGLGSNFLNAPTQRRSAYRIIEHPQFNPANANNNLALIQLNASVALSTSIQPIRLATRTQQSTTFAGLTGRVSGFGVTYDGGVISNQLNYFNTTIVTNAECSSVFGTAVVLASNICGRGAALTTQSICSGDIGGALVLNENGIWTQIGLASFVSDRGCAYGHPAGYIRTSHFVDWVQSVSGIPARP